MKGLALVELDTVVYSTEFDAAMKNQKCGDIASLRAVLIERIKKRQERITVHAKDYDPSSHVAVVVVELKKNDDNFRMPEHMRPFDEAKLSKGSRWAIPTGWLQPCWTQGSFRRLKTKETTLTFTLTLLLH